MERRVVITGMGVITPVGNDLNTFWANLLNGKSGVGLIDKFETEDLPVRIAALVKDFDPENYFDRKEARKIDRFTQFALVAADQAIQQSGLTSNSDNKDRIGVVTGSGIGGIEIFEAQHDVLRDKKARFVSPFFIPMMIPDIIPGHISIKHGFMGVNYSVASACATGSHAIGIAYRHILCGDADVMVTGGAESSVTPLALAGFSNMKALSTRNDAPEKASRPFDKERDGFVMGEGAGMIVLEELNHALKRNAPIFGEICGYGFSGDAHHITAPHPEGEGAARAMEAAIRMSGLAKTDFDYINAHGTSTPPNDKIETLAIKRVFGDIAKSLNISSIKSMTGHLLGAAGGVEFIALAKTIMEDIIPPTINYEFEDPDCDLNYTPNTAVRRTVKAGLSSNFGFGGHNAVIAIKKFES